MSADLLAEFDAYYTAPQKGNSNNADGQAIKSASGLNDLSLFSSSSTSEAQYSSPTTQCRHQTPDLANSNTLGGSDRVILGEETQANSDAWGDFESPVVGTATNESNTTQKSNELLVSSPRSTVTNNQHTANKPGHGPVSVEAATQDFLPCNISNVVQTSATEPRLKITPEQRQSLTSTVPGASSTNNPNVLFDMDELSDDDADFGDFETAPTMVPQARQQQQSDPLIIGSTAVEAENTGNQYPLSFGSPSLPSSSYLRQKAPNSSLQERNPVVGLEPKPDSHDHKAQDRLTSHVTTWPANVSPRHQSELIRDSSAKANTRRDNSSKLIAKTSPSKADKTPASPVNNNTWDWNSVKASSESGARPVEEDSWAWDVVDVGPKETQTASTDVSPPTNVPPPSVLLTILTQLLNLSQSRLFQEVSNQPFSLKNRIMSNPSTINFIRAYILLATVAGRVIAGRKARWKRDTHLSQAMKIGPAGTGGKSGMKLIGVDKAEISREDREASELVRVWKDQVGRLRSAVAIANSSVHDHSTHLIIPEINEKMPVSTASAADGALTAPKPCVVCGLKRDERILKVDIQVEDSFGEWWVEYWGHRTCKNFWVEHEGKLKQH